MYDAQSTGFVQNRMVVATSLFGYPVAPAFLTVNLDYEKLVFQHGSLHHSLHQLSVRSFVQFIKYIVLDILSSCVDRKLTDYF